MPNALTPPPGALTAPAAARLRHEGGHLPLPRLRPGLPWGATAAQPPRRAPHAVDAVDGIQREVERDDAVDLGHVQPPRRDVRAHQHQTRASAGAGLSPGARRACDAPPGDDVHRQAELVGAAYVDEDLLESGQRRGGGPGR